MHRMATQAPQAKSKRFKPSYFYSVISITLVLLLLGILALIINQAGQLSRYFRENIEIAVILKEEVNETETFQFQKRLEGEPYIKSTEYVSKEQAATQLREELGEDFIDLLGYNPLFSSVNIYLNAGYANPDSIAIIKAQLQDYPQVKEIFYQETLVEVINRHLRTAGILVGIISVLFLIVAVTLIDNTLRLAMYSNRFLIRSMQLVGATRWFVIKPFVLRGIGNGLISGLVAVVALAALVWYVQQKLTTLLVVSDLAIFAAIFAGIILLGVLISGVSTYLAVRKYLKMQLDELY